MTPWSYPCPTHDYQVKYGAQVCGVLVGSGYIYNFSTDFCVHFTMENAIENLFSITVWGRSRDLTFDPSARSRDPMSRSSEEGIDSITVHYTHSVFFCRCHYDELAFQLLFFFSFLSCFLLNIAFALSIALICILPILSF